MLAGLPRRRFIQASSAGIASLAAGCTGGDGDQQAGGDQQTTARETAPGTATDQQATTRDPTPEQRTETPLSERGTVHLITDYSNDLWQNRWENEILPGFNEEYGVDVDLEFVATSTKGDQRVITLLQANDPPTMYTSTFGQVGRPLNQGQVRPVNDAVEQLTENLGESYFPSSIRIQGDAYFMPRGSYNGTLVYRRDLYDELSLEEPETWEDLLANVKAVDDNTDVTGIELPATRSKSAFGRLIRGAGTAEVRWKTDEKRVPEIWLEEDATMEALEFGDQLAEYSNDPGSLTYENSIRQWISGRNGHAPHLNMWVGGVAYRTNEEIGLGTDVSVFPKQASADPPDRGAISPEGGSIFKNSVNPEGGEQLFVYMHRTPDRAASTLTNEPMRFIPSHERVVESDTYQSADFFQVDDGYFLDRNMKIINDIQPQLNNTDVIPYTHPASMFVTANVWDQEMLIDVVSAGQSPKQAYDRGLGRAETRLREGLEKSAFS